MSTKKKYVSNVRDLVVYKKALLFQKAIYEAVKKFPEYEEYNMSNILRKSSCSIIANIAEGNTNFYYKKEFEHLNIALSKLAICRSMLDIAQYEYISKECYENLNQQSEEILRMLISLMNRIERCLTAEMEIRKGSNKVGNARVPNLDISRVYDKATTFNHLVAEMAEQYPLYESDNMKDQISRASQSILNNLKLAKSNSYPQAFADLNIAIGSISETRSFLDMSVSEKFISRQQYDDLDKLGGEVLDLILKLMNQLEQEAFNECREVSEWQR